MENPGLSTNSVANPQILPAYRIGFGFDTHRLADGGKLRLGGVDLPYSRHLVGHSDADVLLHAITDGLLGAVAAGDIGRLFPNTDPANKNRNSAEFLQEAYARVQQAGWQLGNLDCVISAERPFLAPHIDTIRQSIAKLLGVNVDQISLKGKTGEKVGPVGREEAIEARCVVLLIAKSA